MPKDTLPIVLKVICPSPEHLKRYCKSINNIFSTNIFLVGYTNGIFTDSSLRIFDLLKEYNLEYYLTYLLDNKEFKQFLNLLSEQEIIRLTQKVPSLFL